MSSEREPKQLSPLLLQAFHDEELEADEARALRTHLEQSQEDRSRLEALSEMGELLRFESEQRVEQVDFSALWASVQARISEPVIAPSAAQRGVWAALRAFFVVHRVVLVPTLAIAVVLAMLLVPMLLRQHGGDVVVEKERTIVVVEPLRLEGQANGTVSYTPGSNTPVIWYLGENQSETTEPVEPKRPLFIPIDSIIKRLERLETLAFPRQNPDASDVRRYNLESLRQTEWYQRHQNDGPI